MYTIFSADMELIARVERSLVLILFGQRLRDDLAMPALEFLNWSCGVASRGGGTDEQPSDGLPFVDICKSLRSSVIEAVGEWHLRFRVYYESDPLNLIRMVIKKPRAEAAMVCDRVIRRFAAKPPCCIGSQFGVPLQPAFAQAVRDAGDGPIDMSQLVDELDVIQRWSKSRCATTVVEKLHKVNKDYLL